MQDLVVATYNIHRCVGTDGIRDMARTLGVIGEIGAQILALQEVQEFSTDPGALARASGMGVIPGPVLTGPDGSYGNLLLTSLEVGRARCVDLSWGRREPRGVIDAHLRTSTGVWLRCLATHLGLARRERVFQQRLLATLLAEDWRGPTLLLGDFNEWHPLATTTRALNRLLGRSHPRRSFPSRLPLLPLDRIWVSPPQLLLSVTAWRSALAHRASDHLPVVARLGLGQSPKRDGPPTTPAS